MSEYIFVTNIFEYSNIFVTLCYECLLQEECAHNAQTYNKRRKKNERNTKLVFSGLCEQGRFARRIVSREDSVRSTHSQYQYDGGDVDQHNELDKHKDKHKDIHKDKQTVSISMMVVMLT